MNTLSLQPFAAEVEYLSTAGSHTTSTYGVRAEVLDREYVLVHEEIHDRLLYETPDGYLLTRLVRVARDANAPAALRDRVTAWARLLIDASLELQESAATYLSIKHFAPSRHGAILEGYPEAYRARAARMAALIDGAVGASHVQYLVALQIAETCLSSRLVPSFSLANDAPHRLEMGVDAERRLERIRSRLSGAAASSLRDRLVAVVRGSTLTTPTGFDPHEESDWEALPIASAREIEGVIRRDLRSWFAELIGKEAGVLPTEHWQSATDALLSRLGAEAPACALLEPTPLAGPLLEAGMSFGDYRRSRREATAQIHRHGLPKTAPALPPTPRPGRFSRVILAERHDAWDSWLVLEEACTAPPRRLSKTGLLAELRAADAPRSLLLVPLSSDRLADSEAILGDVVTAMKRNPGATQVCWYLGGSYLHGLEVLIDAGEAELVRLPFQGTEVLSLMESHRVKEVLTLDMMNTHTPEEARVISGLADATVWLRVLRSPKLPGLWMRALATWGSGQLAGVELMLLERGLLRERTAALDPADREAVVVALHAAWAYWALL